MRRPAPDQRRVCPRMPAERCPTVAALRAAGAILLGKTNISEFCMYYDSDNLVYGRIAQPHDPERMPGGRRGESAAVAAGMPLGLGSDPAARFVSPLPGPAPRCQGPAA